VVGRSFGQMARSPSGSGFLVIGQQSSQRASAFAAPRLLKSQI
jgi:hypothetical protein